MNSFTMLLGWLGGRSFDEMRDKEPSDYGTSIMVGSFGVVSIAMIFGGQYLFWSHLPHTETNALDITLLTTTVYALAYRNLIRSQEVMGRFGKGLTLLIAFGIIGTNTLLAGHELVLLAFKPQAEEQAELNAAKGITEYSTAVENSLGLPQMHGDRQSLMNDISTAKDEWNRVPETVINLRNEAKQCDGIAAKLRGRIPADPETPGYAAAKNAWREQYSRCSAKREQAKRMLADHQKQLEEQITGLSSKLRTLDKKIDEAGSEHEAKLKHASPTLNASAISGFARHKAMWAAVDAARIPAWAAYGLMFIALALEGMGFILKFLLPVDVATMQRQLNSRMECMDGEMRLLVAKAYQANVRPAVKEITPLLADDIKTNIQEVVTPYIKIEMAARTFDNANARVNRAHRRAGKPSPDLLRRLHSLGVAVRKRMHV